MVKLPARPVILGSMQVICPDKKSTCPKGQTCCLLKGGMWGCCPMPKAVCCKDGLHCCPESTTCDVAHGRCNSNSNSLSISWTMVKRTSALTSLTAPPLAVTCPDKSQCPGMSTCCQESSGRYGCCPLVNATCCPDKLHCCPQGFRCQADKCVRQTISVPATTHTRHAAKMPVGGSAIKCPDSNMECPDGTTCCEILKTKKYGCCPKPNAVCCADGVHCCPQGTKCDDKAGACAKAIPWFTKVTAHPPSKKSNSVICPDQQHECPDMNTCCRLSTGEWGCCPLPKAVCCKDGQHCCPYGYTCDPTTAVCNPSGGNRVPKAAARMIAAVQGRYRVKN
ncbi:Progranulin [Lamellibrachia satsuma]|nr:Progranulin [Lamellibrachia satsuma]